MKIERGKTYTNNLSDLEVYVVNVMRQDNVHIKALVNLYTKNSGRCVEYFSIVEFNKNNIKDWYEVKDLQD